MALLLTACAPTVKIPVGSETYRGRYPIFDWCMELTFTNNQPKTLAFLECWSGKVVDTYPPNPSADGSISFGTMRFDNLRIDYGTGIRADITFGQNQWEQLLSRKRPLSVTVPDGTYVGKWPDGCGELTFKDNEPVSYFYGVCDSPNKRIDTFADGRHIRIEAGTLENIQIVDGNLVGIWDFNQRRRKKTFRRKR